MLNLFSSIAGFFGYSSYENTTTDIKEEVNDFVNIDDQFDNMNKPVPIRAIRRNSSGKITINYPSKNNNKLYYNSNLNKDFRNLIKTSNKHSYNNFSNRNGSQRKHLHERRTVKRQ